MQKQKENPPFSWFDMVFKSLKVKAIVIFDGASPEHYIIHKLTL